MPTPPIVSEQRRLSGFSPRTNGGINPSLNCSDRHAMGPLFACGFLAASAPPWENVMRKQKRPRWERKIATSLPAGKWSKSRLSDSDQHFSEDPMVSLFKVKPQ
jgi:hypothetical protein